MLSAQENEALTRVGQGTLMGTYLRRFWTPILLASELPDSDGDPVEVRILGEDLVAFRDSTGHVGLLQAHCPHRLAPLYYGRNEESGLRCIYHGWKFNVRGQCLEMPSEPPESTFKEKIQATAYPTAESGGVIWAYLGPPDLQPEIPDLEWCALPEGYCFVVKYIQECNWVQALEGDLDSSHVSFLHTKLNPAEARPGYTARTSNYTSMDRHPRYELVSTDYGLMLGARREAEADTYYWRITQWLLPYYTLVGGDMEQKLGYGEMYVPIDDTHTQVWVPRWNTSEPFSAEQRKSVLEGPTAAVATLDPYTGRLRANRSNHFFQDRQLQRTGTFSGIRGIREQDSAIVEGMGDIADRTQEHLGSSDAAIIAMRRRLLAEAQAVESGAEPYAASAASAYRVRAWSTVLPRDVGAFTSDPRFQERILFAAPSVKND
jgi:phenylpropionate dioxygenase-like ring-hydroxylating dioxygenase large terminal subunit